MTKMSEFYFVFLFVWLWYKSFQSKSIYSILSPISNFYNFIICNNMPRFLRYKVIDEISTFELNLIIEIARNCTFDLKKMEKSSASGLYYLHLFMFSFTKTGGNA